MRAAGLYDIHANLPALEAVLEDVRKAGVDVIVMGTTAYPQAKEMGRELVMPPEERKMPALCDAAEE